MPGLIVLIGALALLALSGGRGERRERGGRRPVVAGFVAVWVAFRCGVSVVLKGLFGRSRPPVADQVGPPALNPSFPSGHALSTTVLLGMALLLCHSLISGRRRRVLVISVLTAVWVAVGVSRVVLGYHWPSVVVGGWGIGALLVLVARPLLHRMLAPTA